MNNTPLITKEVLEEAGIDLNDQDVASLLEHLNATLEERVGAEVTNSLSDEQLEALVELQENGSDEEVAAWMETNVPELQAIAQDEIDILIGELNEESDALNEYA